MIFNQYLAIPDSDNVKKTSSKMITGRLLSIKVHLLIILMNQGISL